MLLSAARAPANKVIEEVESRRSHLKVEGLDLVSETMKSATREDCDR
jgi:hypothetical protein